MVTQPKLIPGAPTEPDPKEWIQKRATNSVLEKLSHTKEFLRDAGLWKAALRHWMKTEIATEADWAKEKINGKVDELEETWLKTNTFENAKVTREEWRKKKYLEEACSQWCHETWGHCVDSLYLQKKNTLDRACCRILRISDKSFANELYHRVLAKETSFEDAARQFGEGPERLQGGLIPMQPLLSMPFGLGVVLERLRIGEVSTPLRLGKVFCLVELLKFTPCKLDKSTADVLLKEQFNLWIDSVVEILDADLCLMMNS